MGTLLHTPADSNALLAGVTSASPSFIADVEGSYVLGLIVSDANAQSVEDTVAITVMKGNAVPVAHAGNDQSVVTSSLVTLSGANSTDADGDTLSYTWTFVSAPLESTATLSNQNSISPTFTPDLDGDYVFSMVVSDESSSSAADRVVVTASRDNAVPVANAGSNVAVNTNVRVQLDGSASSDADADPLEYHWEFVSRPVFSRATLNNANAATPDFVTDSEGSYVVSLVVNDGRVSSERTTVTVTAARAANPIPENAGIIVKAGGVWHAYNGTTYERYLASSSTTCAGVYAVDIRSNGKLIGVGRATAGMVEVDPFQPVCIASSFRWEDHYGLAIDENDGYWVTTGFRLQNISSTGEVISDLPFSGAVGHIEGLDFASDGTLYGYTTFYGAGNNWVSINPTSGVTTLVANLPITLTGYDIDIDKNDVVRAISRKTLVEFDLSGNIISTRELTELCVSCGFNSVVVH